MKKTIAILLICLVIWTMFQESDSCCGRRRRRRRRQPPPRDTTPPYFYNPSCSSGTYYLPSRTTYSTVRRFWSTPQARDNQDGNVATFVHSPSYYQTYYGEGYHRITYGAKDRAGNRRLCTYVLRVYVPKCPPLWPPSNGYVTYAYRWGYRGTVAYYYCNQGYVLSGYYRRECEISGYYRVSWSGIKPSCVAIQCSSLSAPQHGSISCTNSFYYNSRCTFFCHAGYDLPSLTSNPRTCTSSGQWTGTHISSCTDNTRPVIHNCPSSFPVIHAAPRQSTALVSWNTPTATDTTGLTPSVTFQGEANGSQLPHGVYSFTYIATDAAGNTATCSFTKTVQVTSCPIVSYPEALSISCSHGTLLGSTCAYSCEIGTVLNGSSSAECIKNNGYGEWSNEQPLCTELHCPSLDPPANGYFTNGNCSTLYGTMCYFSCVSGYRMKGNSVLTCALDSGGESLSWSGEQPECEVINCIGNLTSRNMHFVEKSPCSGLALVPYAQQCEVECFEGYKLVGSENITCGMNSAWRSLPVCKEIRCPASSLPTPVNGNKENSAATLSEAYGTTCTLSCNIGYRINGQDAVTNVTRKCMSDEHGIGVWSGSPVSCVPVQCPPLVTDTLSYVASCTKGGVDVSDVSKPQDYNTICRTACNEGYTAEQSPYRICILAGMWEGSDLVCVDHTPPSLEQPPNRVIFAEARQIVAKVPWSDWEPVIATDAGMQVPSGLKSINSDQLNSGIPVTLSEGTYTLTYSAVDIFNNSATVSFILTVKVTRCPALYTPPRGNITLVSGQGSCSGGGAVYGSVCAMSCDQGYVLSANQGTDENMFAIMCNRSSTNAETGVWSDASPTCIIVECTIPEASNVAVSRCPGSTALYGDVCLFQCEEGFIAVNGAKSVSRTCQQNGMFGGELLNCSVEVSCPSHDVLEHGTIYPPLCTTPGTLPMNTNCYFSCDTGYVRNGPNVKTCTGDGVWISLSPVSCVDVQRPSFSNSCPFDVYVNAERGTKQANLEIPPPMVTDNSGNVTIEIIFPSTMSQEGVFQEGITYGKYVATDPDNLQTSCQIRVHVTVLRCPSPYPPAHGSLVNCTDPIYGSQCAYSCNEGYNLNDLSPRTCELNNGQAPANWDAIPPICEAVRCPAFVPHDMVSRSGCIANPPATEIFGTQCFLYCPAGFEEYGDRRPICQVDGSWSSNNFTCERIFCPDLLLPPMSTSSPSGCETNATSGTSCSILCDRTGHQITPRDRQRVTCQYNGQWLPGNMSGASCQDTEHPVFTSCPDDIIVIAKRGEVQAYVTWNVTATDSSEVEPMMQCNSEVGMREEGAFEVSCTAIDPAGNSKTCAFGISVIVRRCRPYQLPAFGSFVGSCNTVWGSECNITCSSGYGLTGSSKVTCEFDFQMVWNATRHPVCEAITCQPLSLPSHVLASPMTCTGPALLPAGTECAPVCAKGHDFVGDNTPILCENTGLWSRHINESSDIACLAIPCPDLSPPDNGSLDCEVLTTGKVCSFSCTSGFDVPKGFQPSQLDCTFSGEWTPYTRVPECLEVSRPKRGKLTGYLCYDGTCGTDETNSLFAQEFLHVFNSSQHQSGQCGVEDQCTIDNVEVTCGSTTGRRRRSATESNKQLPDHVFSDVRKHRVRRSSGRNCEKYQVKFELFANINQTKSKSNFDAAVEVEDKLSNHVEELIGNDHLQLNFTVGGDPVELDKSSYDFDWLVGICEPGSTADNDNYYCVPCLVGTYLNSETNTCVACPKGTYQPDTGQVVCLPCPAGQSTVSTWTRNQMECHDICLPGHYSESGVVPCSPCEIGTYQPSSQSTSCLVCPESTSTRQNGSTTNEECIGCGNSPCENNATCVDLRGDYDCTCAFGYTGRNCSVTIDYCSPDPCLNGGTCSVTPLAASGYECHCPAGYTGVNCSTNIDECRSDPCYNGGHCEDDVNGFTCTCTFSFTGSECQTPICDNIVCQNNGTCNDFGGADPCLCDPRYSGDYCEEPICNTSPCQHGGICTISSDASTPYTCSCTDGYVGPHCEVDFNECASNPCSNGGNCTDRVNNFTCDCPNGFTGSTCDSPIEWCLDNPCGENSTCVGLSDGFQCLCGSGWTGDRCESRIDFCADDPCANGATCENGPSTHICTCPAGYEGDNCETDINECLSSPCQTGFVCVDLVDAYGCSCPAGFTGSNCSIDIPECEADPCIHGTCNDGIDSFTCTCLQGYTGTLCEGEIDNCISSPCRQQSTCISSLSGFSCQCASGFTGSLCETNINECLDEPCFEALECQDGIDDYTCTCKEGFTGKNCETDINDCAFTTCQNGGSCINTLGSFICQCRNGFNGTLCEVNVDDCIDNRCENGATCVDGIKRYSCRCAVGTNGIYCQYTAPPCESDPCQNGGQCMENGTSAFTCDCLEGYEGVTCEVNIDECLSNPCTSGSTCYDQINAYMCQCPLDVTGETCNMEIDDCAGNPCHNNATCIDGIASYTCSCVLGYTGDDCETEIMECSSNPCGNHGSCVEEIGEFSCQCHRGYTGQLCESLISSCVSNPCLNNATCVDGLLQYTCLCVNGYSGETCATETPANFDFLMDHTTSSIKITSYTLTELKELTITIWIQVNGDESYTFLLLATYHSTLLTLKDPCSLQLSLGDETFQTSSNLCDSHWHQITIEVDFVKEKLWIYVDDTEVSDTSHSNDNPYVRRGLTVKLGSEIIEDGDTLRFTNFNLWNRLLSEDDYEDLTKLKIQCQPGIFGDIKMEDFTPTAQESGVYTAPSLCDDTDECLTIVPSPCQNGGNCTQGLNSYECSCPPGFTGPNCEVDLDLCQGLNCQNGGSCVPIETTASCACAEGFAGDFCQYVIVNGNWSDWSEWGECTVTCNGGTASRNRSCTDPPPNDYGEDCQGNSTEERECNIEHCPACIDLTEPSGAILSCEEDGNNTMNCTLACKSGYSFSEPVETSYSCSPETGYRWNHENDINTLAKLPSCTKTVQATEMDISMSVPYPGATCESESDANSITESFNSSLYSNADSLGCSGSTSCMVTGVQVQNCGSNNLRRRKRVAAPLAITFTAYTNTSSTEIEDDSTNMTSPLSFEEVTEAFLGLSNSGAFSIVINGTEVNPATEQIVGEFNTTCPRGTVTAASGGDCAPCAPGTYQGIDENEQICIPCPIGTYQNASGQNSCIDCPEELITLGVYSSDVTECIIACPEGYYHDKLSGDASTCSPCPLNTYQDQKGQERCTSCPVNLVTLQVASAEEDDCVLICEAGFFVDLYNISDPVCTPCPLNTYKEEEGPEEMCTDCPQGYITLDRNSDNRTDCIEHLVHSTPIPIEENNSTLVIVMVILVVIVILLGVSTAVIIYWIKKTGKLKKNAVEPITVDLKLLSTPTPICTPGGTPRMTTVM